MQLLSRVTFLLALCICLIAVSAQTSEIDEILDLVNRARIASGTSPLAPSTILTAVAQAHSDDMAKTGKLSHIGSDGSEFWQRMQTAGYNLSTGAENILVRDDTSTKATFEQWEDSSSHLANMINPVYHEVGLAYTQAEDGAYYYTMVLGARSDSTPLPYASPTPTASLSPTATATKTPTLTPLPPTATPTATLVPPTATLIPPTVPVGSTGEPTISPTPRRALTTGPAQLRMTYDEKTIVLQNITNEPINVNSMIFAGSGGSFPSSRWRDVGARGLNALEPGDCLQIWTVNTEYLDKPDTCANRKAWSSIAAAGQFWIGDGAFTVQKNNRIVAECLISNGSCEFALVNPPKTEDQTAIKPTAKPTENIDKTDVRLYVESDGITIMNVSGFDIDLSTLVFEGETGTFSITEWNELQVEKPLIRFPSGGVCMQLWAFQGDDNAEPSKPNECSFRFAWLLLPIEQQFWLEESFTVINQGVPVAVCATTERICNIILPEEQK